MSAFVVWKAYFTDGSGSAQESVVSDENIVARTGGDVPALEEVAVFPYPEVGVRSIKLLPPENGNIYFGAFPDFGGSEDRVSSAKVRAFEKLVGKNIAWAYFSQNWFRGLTYPKEGIHAIYDTGAMPFVRFMPRSDEEQYHRERHFSLANIIAGTFDDQLRQWARAAKEDAIPLAIDFGVEMNGDWFPWSGIYNGGGVLRSYGDPEYPDGPERYRDAYRHIIDLFRAEGVHHVTWFFHPDIFSNPEESWNEPRFYYPGNDYIDWIGISVYGPLYPGEDYWETFSEAIEKRYKSISGIAADKPIAVLEFGVTDHHSLGRKDQWLKDAFGTIFNNKYLTFSALSYWHENWEEDDDLWATLRIDSSGRSLRAFREGVVSERVVSQPVFGEVSSVEQQPVDKNAAREE